MVLTNIDWLGSIDATPFNSASFLLASASF
jgi:hypothetical protein